MSRFAPIERGTRRPSKSPSIRRSSVTTIFWKYSGRITTRRLSIARDRITGSQYRSAIFYHSPEQEAEAKASRDTAQKHFPRPIVTQIEPAPTFWPAEEYHQQYLEKRGQAHCHI